VQGVRDAGVDAIAQLPGFSAASAARLLAALAPQSEQIAAAEALEHATDVTDDPSAKSELPPTSEIVEQG